MIASSALLVVGIALLGSVCQASSGCDHHECSGHHWNYRGNTLTPKCWPKCYPDCGGSHQSPIDLDPATATSMGVFDAPTWEGPETHHMEASNIGHTVLFATLEDEPVTFTGLNLGVTSVFDQFHFHFGSGNDKGSEHTLKGKGFHMEMHVVTHNNKYATIGDALHQADGVLVYGFFFKVTKKDNNLLTPLINAVKQLKTKGDKIDVPQFPVKSLISNFGGTFFRYSGSLTTPGCYETVTWSTFVEPIIPISKEQMKVFRDVTTVNADGATVPMANNFRETQPLNDRVLYKGTVN